MNGRGYRYFGYVGSTSLFAQPTGILVTGGAIWVASENDDRIARFQNMEGLGYTTFGSSGSGDGQFSRSDRPDARARHPVARAGPTSGGGGTAAPPPPTDNRSTATRLDAVVLDDLSAEPLSAKLRNHRRRQSTERQQLDHFSMADPAHFSRALKTPGY